jgi:hypothetical protein
MPSALRRPCAFQAQPTTWPVHPPWRKAQYSKLTELPAHRLAGEPGTPVRFTFHVIALSVRRARVEPARPKAPVPRRRFNQLCKLRTYGSA